MSNAKFQQWQNDVLYNGLLKLRQADYGDLPCMEVLRELENGIDEIIAAAEVENEDAPQFADMIQDAKDALCAAAVRWEYLNIDDLE